MKKGPIDGPKYPMPVEMPTCCNKNLMLIEKDPHDGGGCRKDPHLPKSPINPFTQYGRKDPDPGGLEDQIGGD